MVRKLFALLLLLSAVVTGYLGVRTLVDPEGMMRGFGVAQISPDDLQLLIAVLGGVLISLALIVLLAATWSFRGLQEGRILGLVCAATLLVVALCAFVFAGSTQVLLLDGIRGIVLLALGFAWKPEP